MIVPVVLGVKVAEQDAAVAFSVVRVQGEPVKAPAAVPALVNVTLPVGVVAPAPEVSCTTAVQVDAWPITTGPVHVTVVLVE
jgi:hypothetical protein